MLYTSRSDDGEDEYPSRGVSKCAAHRPGVYAHFSEQQLRYLSKRPLPVLSHRHRRTICSSRAGTVVTSRRKTLIEII